MKLPLIVLNFKAYPEAMGDRAIRLAKIAEEVSREHDVGVVVAPPITELRRVAESVGIPVFSQHVDPHPAGAWTGGVVAEMIREAGAAGSILNHSEKKMLLAEIAAALRRLRECGLISLMCTDTVETAMAGAALSPDIVAVEPPELIGTGISVSKAKPEVVTGSVEAVKRINSSIHILCGAGISDGEDVARAIELGTEGVLLSSAYVKAKDPRLVLARMAEAAAKAWEHR